MNETKKNNNSLVYFQIIKFKLICFIYNNSYAIWNEKYAKIYLGMKKHENVTRP